MNSKLAWGLAISIAIFAVAYSLGHWEAGLIFPAFLGLSDMATYLGASGAFILVTLSLGGRVKIIAFLGIIAAVAYLVGAIGGDFGSS